MGADTMGLTLTTLRCPDAVPPETRRLKGGEFSLGRGPDNDWVLPDPDRHMSKRHCILAYRSGAWQLTDTSSNGTFLNGATTPIGTGAPKTLRDGDRIRFGAYELEVSLTDDAVSYDAPRAGQRGGFAPTEPMDPFAVTPERPWGEADPFLGDEPARGGLSSALPHDFAPIGEADPFGPVTRSDHTPAINDAFRPPPPLAASIPDDWDIGFSPTPAAASPVHQPVGPPPVHQPVGPPPVHQPVGPPPARPAAILPDFDDLLAPLPVSPPERSAPPAPVPVPPPLALVTAEAETQPFAKQTAAPVRPPPQAAPAAPGEAQLLAAFLEGAGLPDAPADPVATMHAVGAALRATVAGIRQTLIARASIKGEFRIEQTMVRASGNNPLKFSANDDDALAGLLGIGRRNAVPADKAVADALRDMRLHELATMSAMQTAVRALLARLDPTGLENSVAHSSLDKLPNHRRARAWDAFAALHGKVSQALSDDFDSVFGKAFARAYEQALREAQDGDERA